MNTRLTEIVKNFNIKGEITNICENAQGNINSTHLITFNNGGTEKKYLLQKINHSVFKNPFLVMKNITLITNHIRKKLSKMEGINQKTLTLIPTVKNKNEFMYVYTNSDGEKEYYRMYEYIDDCISYNNFSECENPEVIAYNAGECFGFFHKLLSDFPVSSLYDTIPDFHNTPKRFDAMLEAVENNITTRAFEHTEEIVYLISKIKSYSNIWDSMGSSIPVRVTHNDTKLNNILIDAKTHEGIAVIDLDTVMAGSILFDIGDGVRSACSNSFEDETDPEKIFLNLDLTKAYLRGYLKEMATTLTRSEVNNICLSIMTLTYELTLRFLTDYINGDTYFKIKYPEHNKDRFMNQYLLLKDIEEKSEEICKYTLETYNEYTK